MDCVDEELAASTVGARVGHGECAWFVGDFCAFEVLICNVAFRAASSACSWAGRVFAVRAAELDHKVVDDSMEMQSVVESAFGQFYKVACSDGHFVRVKFDFDVAEGRF